MAVQSAPQNRRTVLSVRNVSHGFAGRRVLNRVEFDLLDGQIAALVGPSGCGKSTLLRAILGTHPPQEGEILADGEPILRPTRNVGIVYQHYSLYNFLTARQNVAFGLMLDQTNVLTRWLPSWRKLRKEHLLAADELLEKVQLAGSADRYPHEMSGGMQQRVAIAQALIMKPKVLLLDEPFGALDEATREELQLMLLRLYEENLVAIEQGKRAPYVILIVTHELNEALYVSDRILGLSQYHAEGKEGAKIVYDRPAPVFQPDDARDFDKLRQQREEIRDAVFDADSMRHHLEHVTYWKEVAERQSQILPIH